MEPEKEYAQSHEQMAVVEKYEAVIAYLYPIAQNIGRRHGVAKAMFIECRRTLATIEAMVPAAGLGLPIGSLTSQLFANVYAGAIDRFIHFELGARHWARYMDDIVVLSSNPYELRHWFEDIQEASSRRLGLGISRWQVSPVARGINFLGFRIWPRHKLLRKRSVLGARRTIVRYLRAGDHESLGRFIASWRGHAAHADACNLFNHLEERYGVACH